MKRPLLSFFLIVLVLSALPLGLGAAITATYVLESPIYFSKAPGAFTHPTTFGAKLGRMTVYHTQPLYNPTILTTGLNGPTVTMKGPFTWYLPNGFNDNYQFSMNVVAVAYYDNGGVRSTTLSGRQHLLPTSKNQQVTVNPFIVDFYLVNTNVTDPTQPSSLDTGKNGIFKEKGSYTFVSPVPFNPHFSLAVTNNLSDDIGSFPIGVGPPYSIGSLVAIEGDDSYAVTPVYDTGGTTAENGDGFYYGDPIPQPVNFLFSFLENTVSFTLSEAYGNNNKVTINTAQMQVQNGVSGTTYTQKLTFTDSTNAAAFQLSPTSGSGTPIDFKLYFGGVEMTKGSPHNWTGLVPGMNTKILQVGGINATLAEQRVSGAYSDTITVNITAGP